MAPSGLIAILSFALVALFAASFATPVNALSVQGNHVVRSSHHGDIARRKTSKRKRSTCKAPSSSSAVSSSAVSSSTSQISSTTHSTTTTTTKATSTAAPKTTSTSKTTAAKTSTTKVAAVSTATATSSSSSSGGYSGGKACLAWPNGGANPLAPWKGSQTGLIYSWDANKVPDAAENGFEYVPMLWGWTNAAAFQSTVVEGYATMALGMNEPNESGQSNMDAETGISMWKEYMLPLASKGYTLISPAMSSNPNGKTWMSTFMSGCSDCQVSAIATHYYGTDIEEFKTYVQYWYDTYHLPVYITEYADQNFDGGAQATMDEIWSFMEAATEFVNANDWIKAHCWFGAMEDMDNVNPLNTLMASGGQTPNDLGYYFINN